MQINKDIAAAKYPRALCAAKYYDGLCQNNQNTQEQGTLKILMVEGFVYQILMAPRLPAVGL